MSKIYAFEKEFIDFGVNVGKNIGMDLLTSKLMSILYLEPEEICMEELSKRTGYSLASVSNKLKIIERMGILERRKKPGTKKIYFYGEKDVFKIMKEMFDRAYKSEVEPAKRIIPQIMKKYKNTKLDENGKKKMQVISNYHKQIIKFSKIWDHFNAHMDRLL